MARDPRTTHTSNGTRGAVKNSSSGTADQKHSKGNVLDEEREATESTCVENDVGKPIFTEKKDVTDSCEGQGDPAIHNTDNKYVKTSEKGMKEEENGPGLEKEIMSQGTEVRNARGVGSDVTTDTMSDIKSSSTGKTEVACDEMKSLAEQNIKELIHSAV